MRGHVLGGLWWHTQTEMVGVYSLSAASERSKLAPEILPDQLGTYRYLSERIILCVLSANIGSAQISADTYRH